MWIHIMVHIDHIRKLRIERTMKIYKTTLYLNETLNNIP